MSLILKSAKDVCGNVYYLVKEANGYFRVFQNVGRGEEYDMYYTESYKKAVDYLKTHLKSIEEERKRAEKRIQEQEKIEKKPVAKEEKEYEEEYKAVGNIVYQRDYLVGIYEYRYSKIHKKCETEEEAIKLAKELNDKYNSEIHTDVMHGLIVKEEYTNYAGEICWR